jgi:hypothetical protein
MKGGFMCKCDWKRKAIAGLVLASAYFGMDMFFHHSCLGSLYQETMHLWRPMAEAQGLMMYAYLGYLLFGYMFYCIYGFGVESGKSGWQQGLRFGILIGILMYGAGGLLMYPFALYSSTILLSWFAVGLVEYAILGVLTGLLYKAK